MNIESVTLSGFRSFGPDPVEVSFALGMTAVVGANASGKTALLQALGKLFGVTRAQRTIHRSDFHLPPDTDPEDRSTRTLFVDVLLVLSELLDGTATPETIAPVFRHIRIERDGLAPVCRLRLEASWTDDGTVEGEVSQDLYWINTLEPNVAADQKTSLPPADRGLIQLHYTPANRDAASQIRVDAGALAARLLRAIEWSQGTKNAVEEAGQRLETAFDDEESIKAIDEALTKRWSDLHDEHFDISPGLSLVSRRFEEIVKRLNVVFQRGPQNIQRDLDSLSDGQQSLFYFALAAAVFDMERQVVAEEVEGFRTDGLVVPALTIFAMEEPENHLSPYYLARIIRQVRSMIAKGGAQAIVTSHSPAVISRVEPEEVRFCRCHPDTRVTTVKEVELPDDAEEASKFIRGALMAFPELYFARFVVLVEGDSERVVLPQLAKALGLMLDPAFVAVVPLGGRHVDHFWRLLTHLEIPFATLLDLDLGRSGGGFGRIKTAIKNLISIGANRDELLTTDDGVLTPAEFAKMHQWTEIAHLTGWIKLLANHHVFFSRPLDLDMAMLRAFPAAYAAIIPEGGGPDLTIEEAAKVVLDSKADGLKFYTGKLKQSADLLPNYRYHFMTHSKPATHIQALAEIETEELKEKMPAVLKTLLLHVQENLNRD